ncbi:unnamed protein product [Diamesa serratosioi]
MFHKTLICIVIMVSVVVVVKAMPSNFDRAPTLIAVPIGKPASFPNESESYSYSYSVDIIQYPTSNQAAELYDQ